MARYCGKFKELHWGEKGGGGVPITYHKWMAWCVIQIQLSVHTFGDIGPRLFSNTTDTISSYSRKLQPVRVASEKKKRIWICVVPTTKYKSGHLFWNFSNACAYTGCFWTSNIAYSKPKLVELWRENDRLHNQRESADYVLLPTPRN